MRSLILFVAILMAIPARADDNPDAFTVESFLQVPILRSPVVSPDGSQVVYRRWWRSVEDDTVYADLWLAPTSGGEPRRITYDEGQEWGARWRPDGSLSYLAARGDAPPQVWLNPLDGSEPRPVTEVEGGVHGYWWAPDGRSLAVLAEDQEDGRPARQDEDPEDPEAAEEDAGEEGEIEDEDEDEEEDDGEEEGDFEVFDRLEHPDEFPQLWIVPVEGDEVSEGEARQLTDPPYHVYHAAWSPDGTTLAVTFNERFSSLVDEEQRVALVDAESGELTVISDPERHASLASFSPDGRRVAFFTDRSAEMRAYLNLKDLVVYDLASGALQVLTRGTQLTLGGAGSTPWYPAHWSPDGKRLYLPATEGANLDLYAVSYPGGALDKVLDVEGSLRSPHVAGGVVAYIDSRHHLPGTVRARVLEKKGIGEALDSTDDAVDGFDLRPVTRLELPGAAEGVTVEGFLFLAPGAELEGNHPTIIEMHGGPYYRYDDSWNARYPWQLLAREGFAVFIANPRGGTGYGEASQRATYRGFGTVDFDDLMAAADALVERGIADPDRMGFTGYSYGGLMTNVVVSRTDRFKAAVSIAGLWNFVSAMGQNNPQLLIDAYRQPWSGDLQRLWEHSPASRAGAISTPTLIMHGTEDKPVDPRQSIEMFTYLQLNGVPSRLVLYAGEGHGINRPVHMVDYETREIAWFRHYLLGDEEAEGAEEPLPVVP